MKILVLDIETSPNLAWVWGLWKQNVNLKQLVKSTEMLCYAAKWYGDDEVLFESSHQNNKKMMIVKLWGLLNECDAVIHYNGKRFDMPHINREFLEMGLLPPSPYKQIDLIATAKNKFRFPSNKLDYIVQTLGLGAKVSHAGFDLWLGCMAGDDSSWEQMEEYNRGDILITEKLYEKFKPWISGHPNGTLYSGVDKDDELECPTCGTSNALRPRGFTVTAMSKFQRYRCNHCGKWIRGNKAVAKTALREVPVC